MDITANHVIAVASSISCLGIGLLFWQLKTMVSQFAADHERSRREKSIQLLMHMDLSRKRQSSIARKFAEVLTFEQSKSLLNQEPFIVDLKYKDLVLGSISPRSQLHKSLNDEGKEISIPVSDCADIRWQVVSYLNNIETVLSAWKHNVADRDLIEEQYNFLVSPSDGHYLLKEFREAAGGEKHFPAIAAFVFHLGKPLKKGKSKVA